MSLFLNDVKIPGYDQKISATLSLAGEDLSGQSSNSQQAETGDKPKTLSISTHIKYDDNNDLLTLVNMAEARNDVDERTIYTIINATAKAMNIRQMRFQGDFQIREMEDVLAWTISFKLVEYRSVAETKEQRIAVKSVKDQAANDQPIIEDTTAEQIDQQLSWFEQNVLQKVDDILS